MKISLFMVALFIAATSSAQLNFYNRSLTDSTVSIVYADVDNDIVIYGLARDMDVTVTNGLIVKTGMNSINLKPSHGDSAVLYVHKNGKGTLIFRKAFVIARLPEPAARFGKLTSIMASVDEVLANTTISIELPNCYYRHSLVPVSYRFRIENDATHYTYTKTNYTNKLTEEQKELIKLCLPGTSIIIDTVVTNNTKEKKKGTAMSQAIFIQ